MQRTESLAAAAAYFDGGGFFTDLQRRVAFRTESDTGAATPALGAYLRDELVPPLAALGFECEIVENPVAGGGPFLIARRIEDLALPTVLSYGHGDVVSGQDAHWDEGLGPWTLTVRGDRWYGRGTADNKGQHTIALGGLAAALRARGGRLGYNITWLIETGEEAASPGLHAVCEQRRERLRADLFIASDGPRVSAERPTLFLGSRGAVNFSLRLRARARGYHSGNWGGVLANAATVLSHAVASLVDARGRILVEALRPPEIPQGVREALAGIAIGGGADDPALDQGWGEPGLSPAERLVAWNTIEVLALGAGSPQRPVNAIPSEAVAHCQLRFVVGTPWRELADIVRAHLDAHGFGQVEVQITLTGAATRLDVENPWVGWARQSIEQSSGQRVDLLPNLAGSLPNDVFADLLGLPTLWVPHSYPACAQHAPNEHLLASLAREGLQIMAGLYWDLGEPGLAPWAAGKTTRAAA
ncbi:M20 family metallopeptidase [Variovorax paradoxus]|uniref:M20 family metallopeptidase n=1 Tax=Variovorax paradoxus TaxID=34073 RepID=UPI002782C57C|nr:M20 family metallopeptidase [Variovorax paradoxus]MDQ0586853.1 acetylornithine deacetylase/succinyl-diaminopimelate desuccinylase-like protein [Variovorax paradoxus]